MENGAVVKETSWGLRGGVPAAAEGDEERAVTPATPARLAAIEAEERLMAYA